MKKMSTRNRERDIEFIRFTSNGRYTRGNGLKAVRLICVSCSEWKIVHIPAVQYITKETFWQCLEC